MHILVNPADDLPIYRQIMRQIMEAIAGGRLLPGEKLDSHRELSERVVVAPLTVKKAYDELEALGYLETQRGRGTFVSASLPRSVSGVQQAQLTTAARALLTRAYLAGLTLPDVLALIAHADRTLTNEPAAPRRKDRARP